MIEARITITQSIIRLWMTIEIGLAQRKKRSIAIPARRYTKIERGKLFPARRSGFLSKSSTEVS